MLAQPENEQPDIDFKWQHKEDVVPITVSCGLAEFKGKDIDTIDSAFQRADKAL